MHPKILGKKYTILTFASCLGPDGSHRILSASIRDNILFSHEYDETFYNLVIEGELAPVSFLVGNCNF